MLKLLYWNQELQIYYSIIDHLYFEEIRIFIYKYGNLSNFGCQRPIVYWVAIGYSRDNTEMGLIDLNGVF
jgi:hypothetical protein